MYPDAEKIVLVVDKLNTHKPSSLYKRYLPEEARRIIKKAGDAFKRGFSEESSGGNKIRSHQ